MEYFVLAVAVFCLPLAGSEDLYWRPNTDWINPNNWKHGRVPCEGDVADFSSVPRGSVIRLDGSATIRSVVLPVGSSIELGKSLTLQFSSKSETFAFYITTTRLCLPLSLLQLMDQWLLRLR
jgi:hypothetical protein